MLHEGILHKCIKQLLEKKKNIPLADMSEDLECLCHLMRTVGRRLDTNKAKVLSGILFWGYFHGSKWSFLRSAHTPDWFDFLLFFPVNHILVICRALLLAVGVPVYQIWQSISMLFQHCDKLCVPKIPSIILMFIMSWAFEIWY